MISVKNFEKLLKYKTLLYKQIQEEKQQNLIKQAEFKRKIQIENLLNEAAELKKQGKLKQAKLKSLEAKKLGKINLSFCVKTPTDGITTQKRFKCKITDSKLVPCFFYGIEIREISTKKLLEIRKENPNVKIPGVKFYQMESLVIKS